MKRYLCKCNCGKFAKLGNKFINGHNGKLLRHTEEVKRKIGKIHRGKIVSKESKEKNRQAHLGKKHTEESINKMRMVKLGRKFSEEHKNKIRIALTGIKHSKERRKKNSEGVKKCWQNPEYREKCLKAIFAGMHLRPTKPERRLRNRLNHLFPDEYKYVGNGSTFIGGKCPDFININGQKKIIEMFGNYWHGEERTKRTKYHEEQRRIRHFARYGFRTLIVWESELKNRKQLKKKLLSF